MSKPAPLCRLRDAEGIGEPTDDIAVVVRDIVHETAKQRDNDRQSPHATDDQHADIKSRLKNDRPRLFGGFAPELQLGKMRINPAAANQLEMRTGFDDPAFLHDEDTVGFLHRC